MRNSVWKSIVAVALLSAAGAAFAGSSTANLGIEASVAANCTINTTSVKFGSYDPILANATDPLNATGTVTIACTKGAAPKVSLDLGSSGGSSRQMNGTKSNDKLAYELYQQQGTGVSGVCSYTGATVWGATGTAVFTPTTATSKASRSYNVCGQVAGGQDVSVDTYSDTVVATVLF